MNKNSKRMTFGKVLAKIVFYITCLAIGAGISIGVTMMFGTEENKATLISYKEAIVNFFAKDDGVDYEEVSVKDEVKASGALLSSVCPYKVTNYIDFTIPYTWQVGRVETDDASIEEAIAVTGDNCVMTVFLRNIETKKDAESMKWAQEALIFELENMYPDCEITTSELSKENAIVVNVAMVNANASMYVALIPLGEKNILVTHTFSEDDWVADLYFTTAISEMTKNI